MGPTPWEINIWGAYVTFTEMLNLGVVRRKDRRGQWQLYNQRCFCCSCAAAIADMVKLPWFNYYPRAGGECPPVVGFSCTFSCSFIQQSLPGVCYVQALGWGRHNFAVPLLPLYKVRITRKRGKAAISLPGSLRNTR
jgi:hypothetical protein